MYRDLGCWLLTPDGALQRLPRDPGGETLSADSVGTGRIEVTRTFARRDLLDDRGSAVCYTHESLSRPEEVRLLTRIRVQAGEA